MPHQPEFGLFAVKLSIEAFPIAAPTGDSMTALLCAQATTTTVNPLEKGFEQSMSGVTLTGHFTQQSGTGPSDDKYTIDKMAKLKDDLWRFDTRIQYGGNDAAGIPAREVGRRHACAVPSSNGHGGQIFGDIVKAAQ
jgi:hypothetical protein